MIRPEVIQKLARICDITGCEEGKTMLLEAELESVRNEADKLIQSIRES